MKQLYVPSIILNSGDKLVSIASIELTVQKTEKH